MASFQRRRGQDPLWYKDAVIYETHVKTFYDSNGDGIGDLRGLVEKLDYLQDLGVTCLWLLPFFPSPLKDDGYDISDYGGIHPDYGTLEDFRELVAAAHARGIRVLVELVVNHTSDQHPWFQRARRSPPGSPERAFYVWSDTDQKYQDARIIFTDTEKSNWTWDPEAKQYYWHRFFSHQPDLNFENPRCWRRCSTRSASGPSSASTRSASTPCRTSSSGRDELREPAPHARRDQGDPAARGRAPPRPHAARRGEPVARRRAPVLRRRRRVPHGVPLPAHAAHLHGAPARGRGADRGHHAAHAAIPETCQWALFLRNHDELTLEMVTNDERDYMYLAYAQDPRMKINVGIRRRLAPLVDNSRRRIELLNSLLFSFPGTPVVYYGDEIGHGRQHLPARPQRRADADAVDPRSQRRLLARRSGPPLLRAHLGPVYGYQAVNVEAQSRIPSSLLHWMRNTIALRKLFKAFGRGTIEFLPVANRKVLAYVRRYEDEVILCVANVSRSAQPAELDLSAFEGHVPVEMLGYTEFPRIGQAALLPHARAVRVLLVRAARPVAASPAARGRTGGRARWARTRRRPLPGSRGCLDRERVPRRTIQRGGDTW